MQTSDPLLVEMTAQEKPLDRGVCRDTLLLGIMGRDKAKRQEARLKTTYPGSPVQFLTSLLSTGGTMLYWELLLHGKMIGCCT